MQLLRVKLANLWFTKTGKRYRPGEHYLPYELLPMLPSSATLLPEDAYIRRYNAERIIQQAEADIEYYTANPHGQEDADVRVAAAVEHLALAKERLANADEEPKRKHPGPRRSAVVKYNEGEDPDHGGTVDE